MAIFFTSVAAVLAGTSHVKVPGFGTVEANVLGSGLVEALGLPFAQSPTGARRFRPPEPLPAESGDNPVDGTSYGPVCLQVQNETQYPLVPMSEDCLTLNIWAPPGAHALPVLVWIHGGAWVVGSGRLYNGSVLAAQQIVVVTVNYRLGVLGWLPLQEIADENPKAPGNGGAHGLLDQVAALDWVRQHIAGFGGDPAMVTIAGESAGSLSTCTHLQMPVSQGLFHQAILESGFCDSPWIWDMNTTKYEERVPGFFAAANTTTLAGLRQLPADFFVSSEYFGAFRPIPDGFWLPGNPADLPVLFHGGAVIVGSNTMDTLAAPPFGPPLDTLSSRLGNSTEYKAKVAEYFGNGVFDYYPMPSTAELPSAISDAFFALQTDVCNSCPKLWQAERMLQRNTTVFAYEFGFETESEYRGQACHMCEVAAAFGQPADFLFGDHLIGNYLQTAYSPALGERVSAFWAQFVKEGRPGGVSTWPDYRGGNGSSLQIGTGASGNPTFSVAAGQFEQKCAFFHSFIRQSPSNRLAYEQFCNNGADFKPPVVEHRSSVVLV